MRAKEHRHWVLYKGRIFHGLPKGKHGTHDPEIQVGHVKNMIKFLGIDMECAKQHLPILR